MFCTAAASDGKITPVIQQQYLLHINKAKLFSADSLYQKACDEYEIAFHLRKDYALDLFACAYTYDKLNDMERTMKYLKLSIEGGFDLEYEWVNNPAYLTNLKKANRHLPLSQFDECKKAFYQKMNMDYYLKLEKLVAQDQVIRKIKKSDFAQITDTKAKNMLMGIVDSTNMVELKALIEKYGYPQYSSAGFMGEMNVFILLLHGLNDGENDSLHWAYYQPLILKEVKDGNVMPDHYAYLYDRIISKSAKGKECYGTQFTVNSNGTYGVVPIYDIENVDIRRREIGLPTLEDAFKLSGLKLPEGYVRK